MSTKRFRIAFSFAGEKRGFVSEVAAILAGRFSEAAILYDKYHEAEFARRDLGIYLPNLYHAESDLVVVVVCPAYDDKEWTGLEWAAIHDLLKKRRDNEVMLCRFERADVKGLYSTAGFVELDAMTPGQAADRILERLALNEGRPKDLYTKPASVSAPVLKTSIPNNLPRLQPFFGRETELAAIREALDPESRTWGALIDGPGGMGKTSLAVRAAYACEPNLFQRIIFISVKDREMDDDGERRLSGFILSGLLEMLNELARELEGPDSAIVKAPEDQRIRLLLDALRPTRALLILDNLESLSKDERDQLFTFVKRLPQGCKAILTSRRRIGSGSELLILQKLDEPAALETLADLARHNPLLAKTNEAERITLYRHTGGTPLLLRWVAGQLGRGSCRTFTDALHFLRSCPQDNDPLEFVFGDLVQEFAEEETRVLAALTYFTLPAKLEHIVELADLDEEAVETALRTLSNRSLVVPDQEEKYFALVPMVADFLRRKRPEVVQETGSRLEERAYALIVENVDVNHERLVVLDSAWPTVAPALPLFLAGPNSRLQTVCRALSEFLNFTGRWDERIALSEQAEAKAVVAGDYKEAGWRAYDTGWMHYLRAQADAVLACADRAATYWQTRGSGAVEQAQALRLRGVGYELKQEYPAAIATYREVLDLRRTLTAENAGVALALSDLADVHLQSHDYAAAEEGYREALRMAHAIGYVEGVAIITGNLAELSLGRKDWPAAEVLAREALSVAQTVGRQELIGTNSYRLGRALLQQRKITEARTHARYAMDIFSRLGHARLNGARAMLTECELQS
jgi:tetratricopeptide (TPR) repeat protein